MLPTRMCYAPAQLPGPRARWPPKYRYALPLVIRGAEDERDRGVWKRPSEWAPEPVYTIESTAPPVWSPNISSCGSGS